MSSLSAQYLRCEYLVNPLGIDVVKPRLTWVLISEIFPNNIRGTAISVAVIALWAAYFILVFTFPVIEKHFGDASAFWGYSVICVLGFLFIYFKLPETKGKSLEEIEGEFLKGRH